MIIGITGSIATGKTFVTDYLLKKGYKVIDADVISRGLLEKNGKCYQKVIDSFNDILLENGDINRQKLGKLVFNDRNKKKTLEEIVHPEVIETIFKKIDELNIDNIFVSMPLLYEVGFEKYVNKVIVVYANKETQIERLMRRDNIDRDYAINKINNQMSLKEKVEKCDFLIDNSYEKEKTIEEIEKVLRKLEV